MHTILVISKPVIRYQNHVVFHITITTCIPCYSIPSLERSNKTTGVHVNIGQSCYVYTTCLHIVLLKSFNWISNNEQNIDPF